MASSTGQRDGGLLPSINAQSLPNEPLPLEERQRLRCILSGYLSRWSDTLLDIDSINNGKLADLYNGLPSDLRPHFLTARERMPRFHTEAKLGVNFPHCFRFLVDLRADSFTINNNQLKVLLLSLIA
jgi:hypothetical protein